MKNYEEYTYEIIKDIWEKGNPYQLIIPSWLNGKLNNDFIGGKWECMEF